MDSLNYILLYGSFLVIVVAVGLVCAKTKKPMIGTLVSVPCVLISLAALGAYYGDIHQPPHPEGIYISWIMRTFMLDDNPAITGRIERGYITATILLLSSAIFFIFWLTKTIRAKKSAQ